MLVRSRYGSCSVAGCSVNSNNTTSPNSYWNCRSYSTSSNNNGQSPALVAIDSKIEQAMDLVKTHLMFAVREEVEVLRNKIIDLESHIHHLETENAVLRDHIPEDLLKSLNISKSK